MAKVVASDKLSQEIKSILNDYGNSVDLHMAQVVKDVARVGANNLRVHARTIIGNNGKRVRRKYTNAFAYNVARKRMYTEGVIYNRSQPGLAHLLEHGHVTKNGTKRIVGDRTPAYPHIKRIEDQIIAEFEQKVKTKL